jgi:hypothetical protein
VSIQVGDRITWRPNEVEGAEQLDPETNEFTVSDWGDEPKFNDAEWFAYRYQWSMSAARGYVMSLEEDDEDSVVYIHLDEPFADRCIVGYRVALLDDAVFSRHRDVNSDLIQQGTLDLHPEDGCGGRDTT